MSNAVPAFPTLRRFALYGLILLALVMLSAVVFVFASDERTLTAEEAFPEPVVLSAEKRPRFVFPISARTFDLSLNRFVDRFARVCMEGKYSEFRLMLSRRRPPILPDRFESNFNALRRVTIQSIDQAPVTPGQEGPLYLMTAQYELEDYAVRGGEKIKQVVVGIAHEEGQWRLGPIPSEAIDQLRALKGSPASMPSDDGPVTGDDSPESPSDDSAPPTAAANRPARIDS